MLFLLLFLFLLETVLSLQIDGLVEGQVFLFWLLLYILQFCLEVVWLMRTKLDWGLFKLSSWYVELFTVQLGSRLLIGDCGYKIISYHYCILLDLNMLERRCRLSQQIGVETRC